MKAVGVANRAAPAFFLVLKLCNLLKNIYGMIAVCVYNNFLIFPTSNDKQ